MWSLAELGWNEFFELAWTAQGHAGCVPARVVEEQRGAYRLYAEAGALTAEVAGRLRHDADNGGELPAVGDWLAVEPRWDEERATIRSVLPRRTKVARKGAGRRTVEQVVAANIDVLLVMCGLDGDFNLRRIERYVALAWESGAEPVVVLNKADLCADLEARLAAAASVAPQVPIYAMSAVRGGGVGAIETHLGPGRTIALVGSSGVGKSTLLNRLFGAPLQHVEPTRVHDSRGRHATTARRLVLLPGRGLLVDTPGMRELGLWEAEEGLGRAFADIEQLAGACHFRDCRHESEPLCAVREAIDAGELDPARFESRQKLVKEQHYLALKTDTLARLEQKRRWKRIHKAFRGPRWPG